MPWLRSSGPKPLPGIKQNQYEMDRSYCLLVQNRGQLQILSELRMIWVARGKTVLNARQLDPLGHLNHPGSPKRPRFSLQRFCCGISEGQTFFFKLPIQGFLLSYPWLLSLSNGFITLQGHLEVEFWGNFDAALDWNSAEVCSACSPAGSW